LCGGSVGGVDEYEMDGRELLLDIMAATCLIPGNPQHFNNVIIHIKYASMSAWLHMYRYTHRFISACIGLKIEFPHNVRNWNLCESYTFNFPMDRETNL
jgi:hypothetical protein